MAPKKDSLLKDAIADAKLVKETAIAAARQQLEEAFTPQLNAIMSSKLRTEANLEDTSGIGGSSVTVKDPGPTEPSKASWDSSDIKGGGHDEEPFGKGGAGSKGLVERQAFGKGGAGAKGLTEDEFGMDDELGMDDEMGMGGEADVDVHPDGMGGDDINLGLGGAPGLDGGADVNIDLQGGEEEPGFGGGFGQEHDLDLEAIIKALEADVHGHGNGGSSENAAAQHSDSEHQGKDTLPEDATEANNFAHVDSWKAGKQNEGKTTRREPFKKDKTWNEGTEVIKKNNWGEAGEEVKPGESVTEGEMGKMGVGGGKEVKPGEEVTESYDLDEILREMEAEDESSMEESEKIAAENANLKSSLSEHRKVVQYLKDKLQEVNMLNTKLLYTNKIFKSHALNGQEKIRVVETFDRATTLREVKLIYATLAESLSTGAKKNVRGTKAITEGMASRASGSTKPKSTQVLTEQDDVVSRLQMLAGIKKQVL